MNRTRFACTRKLWQGRDALVLSNGVVRLTTLLGGGHIAQFTLEADGGSLNPLWVPPWSTIDPSRYREKIHRQFYGTITEGKLLSGLAGHSICLDYFGSPSPEEAQQGISQHGEAPCSRWRVTRIRKARTSVALTTTVRLPISGLIFSREIELRQQEPVTYFTETVRNTRRSDHFFHWIEHVTLGSPFLSRDDARITIPGTRALTDPHGYDEGKALLASNEEFRWPNAPLRQGGSIDLSQPFSTPGLGFVVAILIDERRQTGFVAAVNKAAGFLIAYCFRRADFPWIAVWEENCAIQARPWSGRTRARGLEFGTTPLPLGRRESFLSGQLFGIPTMTYVPALAKTTIRYVGFVARLPKAFGSVRDIAVELNTISIHPDSGRTFVVPAEGVVRFLNVET